MGAQNLRTSAIRRRLVSLALPVQGDAGPDAAPNRVR